MKLFILLSIAALASCDYPTGHQESPPHSYATPISDEPQEQAPSSASLDSTKSIFNFQSFYKGAFPPSTIPHVNFLSQVFPNQFSYKYPLRSYAPSQIPFSGAPQGILPPISQVIPPISQVIPPVFSGVSKPILPVNPSQILPPQVFPPQVPQLPQTPQVTQLPQIPQTTQISQLSSFSNRPTQLFFPKYNYAFPSYFNTLSQYPYFTPPFTFPFSTTLNTPTAGTTTTTNTNTNTQKEPTQINEPLSTSYGAPSSTPVESSAEFDQSGPAETSAPFEPAPVSYPYEPAVPETPEPAPYKPAQEYGLPSN